MSQERPSKNTAKQIASFFCCGCCGSEKMLNISVFTTSFLRLMERKRLALFFSSKFENYI